MKDIFKNIPLLAVLCLTVGLAPFFPEPHIWGKLKWILGGAEGMGFADWFDVLLHGFPWVLLLIALLRKVNSKSTSE